MSDPHCRDADVHCDWANEKCPTCGFDVDEYGNTEADPIMFCAFPNCGCDGARLCMAERGPSEHSEDGNVEGMWSGKTHEQRRAAMELMSFVARKSKEGRSR